MSAYRRATADLVQGAKGVVSAVDMFKTAAAGGDPGDIRFATDLLVRAADNYTGSSTQHERFGFNEMASTPDTDLPKRERFASDVLASALVDIEVGNALIVAGQVAGETPEPASVEDLDTVARQLNDLTSALALPMGKDVDTQIATARFGFDEVSAAVPTKPSGNLATAKAGFEERATQVLEALVTETKKVLDIAFRGVEDLDDGAIAEAVGVLGETVEELPKVGKLVAKGLQLAAQALEKITKLLGPENAKALQEKAEEIVGQIKEGGDLLNKFLSYSFGVEKAKAHVKDLLSKTPDSIDFKTIDGGTKQLADLQTRFAEQMAMVVRITKGLNTIKKYVGKLLLPEVTAVVLFGAFYLVAMDYAVLAGMDYADTTTLITFVEGVLKIAEATLA